MSPPPSSGGTHRSPFFVVVPDSRQPASTASLPYLLLGIADEAFGVPFLRVREVQPAAGLEITECLAPGLGRTVRLRDRLLPLFDLRATLGSTTPPPAGSRFVVVSTGLESWLDAPVAVLVDRVGPVVTLERHEIEPVPHFGDAASDFVLGIGRVLGERRFLINVDLLVASDNAAAVRPPPERPGDSAPTG